jgi:hypothetical protein|tara:strand:- start:52 stop:738 length:687 start_codon:yes stop_codon:yes gene_type:complete
MILKEFKSSNARTLSKLTRALAENYNYNINLAKMTTERAAKMATKAIAKVNESQDVNRRIKFAMIAESLDLWMQANVQSELTAFNLAEGLDDDSMEEAKVILAAKELSDKIQGMIEDAAKMQVQDLLPIVDAMRSEVGQAEAEGFATQADAALAGLVAQLKTAKTEYDSAIQTAQGLTPANDMDMDMDMGDEIDGMDVDMSAMDDEFGGDAANVGDAEPTGREMKAEM